MNALEIALLAKRGSKRLEKPQDQPPPTQEVLPPPPIQEDIQPRMLPGMTRSK